MTELQVPESPDSGSPAATEADAVTAAGEGVLAESQTPGSVLRRAREVRGQSIPDVVQVIRFSARQIEALERDDYASLPGSTAVRGMVRNYAKFLKLDAAPLLAQLDPAVPLPEADVRPPTNMGEAEQPGIVQRVPPRWVAGGVLVLLALIAGYWYFIQPVQNDLTQVPSAASGNYAVVPQQVPAPAPPVTSSAAVVAENQLAITGAASAVAQAGGLRVEFDDRSWIEIRDAAQQVIFVGEYPAGTRQNIDGRPPFQVWIGKASGVRLYRGERSIDLRPHTREEVARFSLE
ncbi:MAG: DUF4115 domain-containing protein [Sulfuritalea sp.]|nr:DUF4115 domain-containing protein [Sulfuritalea sp.]